MKDKKGLDPNPGKSIEELTEELIEEERQEVEERLRRESKEKREE
jgi:hypothetical protein